MSFEDAPIEEGMDAEPGPELGDTGEAVEQPDDGGGEPPRQYVEVDDPDNRWDRVKVDGEDVEVPYSELKRGYSREADYTRKAQEVARQRQEAEYGLRLQQALQANPEMTLQILAQQHGIAIGQQPQPQTEPEPEYTDPLERALAEERQARLALEQRIMQRESDQELERAVNGLRSQYNVSDEDLQQVVSIAYQGGYNYEAFPMIYKNLAFDRIQARVTAQRQRDAEKEADQQRRQAAKTSASQIIGSGSGAVGTTMQRPSDGKMDIRAAIEAAIEQAEGRS